MRFLSLAEAVPLVSAERISHSHAGRPIPTLIAGQNRIDIGMVRDIGEALPFVEALIRWLPPDADRIWWLTNWSSGIRTPFEAFRAMRDGLGATSELGKTPVCQFEAQPWTDDQLEMTVGDGREAEALAGMILLAMVSDDWNAWLLSSASDDAIELWENNLFFHSGSRRSTAAAKEILGRYELRPPI
jgi:hypothetical protein